MFHSQHPPEQTKLPYSKREHFRLQIRDRQIQELMKQIRHRCYELKDPSDYELLYRINLPQLIAECKKNGLSTLQNNKQHNQSIKNGIIQNIHKMFLYASSKNSDHLFELLDDRLISMLISALAYRNYQNQQTVWNREILWILTNYTAYSQIIDNAYLNQLSLIANQIFIRQKQHQYMEQTQQNIILSISNWISNSKSCRQILSTHANLIQILLQRYISRRPQLTTLNASSKLLNFYTQLLLNLFTVVEYFQLPENLRELIIREMVKILQHSLGQGLMNDDQSRLSHLILQSLVRIFGNSIDNEPIIIVTHKKQIKKLSCWFERFIKTQNQSTKSDSIIVSYLEFLAIIFGPNIPEQLENPISKFYLKHFQNHVGKVCTSLFICKNPLFHTWVLRMLQPVLMEEYMTEMIVADYLQIVSYIFFHITNSGYGQKREALTCIVNLIKSTIYDSSTTAGEILELLLTNKIADILAYNLWEYVDNDLNMEILVAIQVLLEADKNKYGAKIKFWQKFQETGGGLKMERIMQESSNSVLKEQVIKILESITSANQY